MAVCANPSCKREFVPGHYGKKQRVCSSPECRAWYRTYWRETRRAPRGIPDETLSKIITSSPPLLRTLILVARDTGLRKGELLGLTWGDVLDRGGGVRTSVEIRGQWVDGKGFRPTKTKCSRLAYLTRRAVDAIREVKGLCAKHPKEGRVWPVSESWVWSEFHRIQKILKICNQETGQPYRFHDLRHSLGTELVRAGRVDLARKILGHRRIETTLIYAEQAPDEVVQDLEEIRRSHHAARPRPNTR